MRFIRTVQDLENALVESLIPQLDEISAVKVAKKIINDDGTKTSWDEAVKVLQKNKLDYGKVAEFSETLFQLRDYKDVLKGYIELLLQSQNYEQVCAFVNRMFMAHVGDCAYVSKAKSYRIEERYFDRFVEVVRFCDIPVDMYLPFFLNIFKSEAMSKMFVWKEPLKEYLQTFIKNSEKDFIKFLSMNKSVDGIEFFLQINTLDTVAFLVDCFINNKYFDADTIGRLLLKYKRECFNEIERHLANNNEKELVKIVELLCYFKGDRAAEERIVELLKGAKNVKVKESIEKELGVETTTEFANQETFDNAVRSFKEPVQERLYGLRLKKYYEQYGISMDSFDAKVMTFVMEKFKVVNESQLKYMSDYFKFVSPKLRVAIANIVFETALFRDKLQKSKWAIRLISCFADKEMFEKINQLIGWWYSNFKDAAEYFVDCVSVCGQEYFIGLVKYLKNIKMPAKYRNHINRLVEVFAKNSTFDIFEIEDMLVNDFGLSCLGKNYFDLGRRILEIKVNPDLTISYFNEKTGKPARISNKVEHEDKKIKDYVISIRKEILAQTKKFVIKFNNNKRYSRENFEKLIINHNLLSILAGGIIWGKYSNDKLYQIFTIKEHKEVVLWGSEPQVDYVIGMVHSIELDDKVEMIKEKMTFFTFDQLVGTTFDKSAYAPNIQSIDTFSGVFTNAKMFINKLKHRGYRVNNLTQTGFYNQMVKPNENMDLLTEVEFDFIKLNEEDKYTTTISKIRFYRLSKLLKEDKNFILNKADSLQVGTIPARVLSDELVEILNCTNK